MDTKNNYKVVFTETAEIELNGIYNYILLYHVDESVKQVNIIHAFYGRKNYLRNM